MQFLPTAFSNLSFAWKLYNYGLSGKIDRDELDIDITFQERNMVLVLPQKIFHNDAELIVALENNLVIAFGAAAITLNRAREEQDIKLPSEIATEADACVCVIYQIRNAFAHDIAQPTWKIRHPRYQRKYEFGGIEIDLTKVNGEQFRYEHIGGPDVLEHIRNYAEEEIFKVV